MCKYAIAVLVIFPLALQAQSPKNASSPVIPVEVREKYFKAVSEFQEASMQAQEAAKTAIGKKEDLQKEIESLNTACGPKFRVTKDAHGDLVCTQIATEKQPETSSK